MPRANLNRDELQRVALYFELLQRYQHLAAEKMLPIVAVRTMCVRRGYDRVMGALGRWGEDAVAGFALDELKEMARLWAFMVHEDPPPEENREGVMNSIKMTRDAYNNPETRKRIFALLARCNIREAWLREKQPATKAH